MNDATPHAIQFDTMTPVHGPHSGLSVVVPAFNSEASLPMLVAQLSRTLKSVATHYEIILVNDGSSDRTWEMICGLAAEHSFVRGINLMRNFGQHNAVLCGLRAAQFDTIVTMDDDLQHPVEEIPRLLDKLDEGYDVVYGAPQRQQHGLLRKLASQTTKLVLQSTMGAENARQVSPFRALRTSVVRAFDNFAGSFVSIDVLLTWGACKFAAVRVRHERRKIGTSNYSWRQLTTHAMNMVTGFSTLPLQLASWIGFTFTLFGMGILAYVLGSYILRGTDVPGFAFLASTIAILAGAQLFSLGMIGEYLARMHFRLMDKPSYVVREEIEVHAKREAA